jgi:predicted nucleic acid-binding protein
LNFVLDASVALGWLLTDLSPAHTVLARRALALLRAPQSEALVPAVWPLEIANVLARSEARGLLVESQSVAFTTLLGQLSIHVDVETAGLTAGALLELARRHRLSAYDASYLELALRQRVKLATADADLRKAATRAGVELL